MDWTCLYVLCCFVDVLMFNVIEQVLEPVECFSLYMTQDLWNMFIKRMFIQIIFLIKELPERIDGLTGALVKRFENIIAQASVRIRTF